MVGGGILAGVALASAQLFKDQKTAQRKVDQEQKLTVFHQGLSKMMGNAAHCNATMSAAGLYGNSISAGQTFSRFSQCGGNCIEKEGNQDHDASDVTVGPDLFRVGNGQFIDKSEAWEILDVSAAKATSATGPVHLKVKYRMNPKLTGGVDKIVYKDLVMNARFEGGRFKECVNAQESSINNLQNDICKTLNFGNVTSNGSNSGKLATWNPITQTCEIGADKNCEAQGLVVDSIDSTGEVKCRKLTSSNDAPKLQQSATPQTCSTGQKATLQYDSITKKFKVICTP